MREIKFRAVWYGETYEVSDIQWFPSGKVRRFKVFNSEGKWLYANKDIVLREYTGLKDKNGTEIYEGDICKYYDSVPDDQEAFDRSSFDVEYDGGWHDKELIGEVIFKEFGFWVGGTRWFDEKTEVIGNIDEAPELLNSEQQPSEHQTNTKASPS